MRNPISVKDIFSDSPEVTQKDQEIIRYLCKKTKITKKDLRVTDAKKLYYFIVAEGITFESSVGYAFMEKVSILLSRREREQIRKRVVQRKSSRKAFRNQKAIVLVALLCAVGVSLLFLTTNLYEDFLSIYRANQLKKQIEWQASSDDSHNDSEDFKEYGPEEDMLEENTQQGMEGDGELLGADVGSEPVMDPAMRLLYEQNAEYIGWLTIPGTSIDYPVMQKEKDNEYYLAHNFFGEPDRNGLLVLDDRCDILQIDHNLLIYGHNMKTGAMFGTLKRYKDYDYYVEHREVQFHTIYGPSSYEVVAVMLSKVAYQDEDVYRYYDAISMETTDQYLQFWNYVMEHSLYNTGATHTEQDSFLMLSTCDYQENDGRLVVICKKVME